MPKQHYDVIVVGDFSHSLCRTTSATDQIIALVGFDYRVGLLQIASRPSACPEAIHPPLRTLIDDQKVVRLDPDQALSTSLLIAMDTGILAHRFRRSLRIDAGVRIVLVTEGQTLSGPSSHDGWADILRSAFDLLGGDAIWAPVNPVVRRQLDGTSPGRQFLDDDCPPCLDPEPWFMHRMESVGTRPTIGGDATDPASWPDDPRDILALYPDDPRFRVRLLQSDPRLLDRVGSYPRNWDILSPDALQERDFLASVGFYVHCHHPARDNPVDPLILKAMASGAVTILPPTYKPIFGNGAIYAHPEEVGPAILALHANKARYLEASQAATRCIVENHSPSNFVRPIERLIGPPPSRTKTGASPMAQSERPARHRRRVLFITINGVGMGHLTRMLAIAKRCPEPLEPVFLTMSQALKVLRQQGYLAEFVPSRKYVGHDVDRWNDFLEEEVSEMISFYDPAVVVFDGNVPYRGIMQAIKSNSDPWYIWSRRGMWRSESLNIIEREEHFDLVLEPGDLAAPDDHGITARHRQRTCLVDPIRLLDRSDMLPREEARRKLGLAPDRLTALVQLGAGNNYDFKSIHKIAFDHLRKNYDAQIAVGEWLITDNPIDIPDDAVRMPDYPFAQYFNAFDFAISAVGYNSFHELLFAGIPTILVPNEATEQDNQLARALYADRQGLAACVQTKDIYRFTATIDRVLQPEERERIISNLSRLDQTNGAAEAALLIDELAYSHRVDRS